MRKVRSFLINGSFFAAIVGGLYWTMYLQEVSSDSVPDAAGAAGIALPLKNPYLEVNLEQMAMRLKVDDQVVRSYDIGYGPGFPGSLHSDQPATPLGEFKVAKRHKRSSVFSRGSRFLEFYYPNEEITDAAWDAGVINEEEYSRLMAAINTGQDPPKDTALGGPIGIQGNFFAFRTRRFTDGSIALSNGEINELFEYVTEGMRVVILER